LDGLRGVAILMVMLFHFPATRTWFPGGSLGVDLFFVLSGFLITTLLLEERSRTGRISLPAFFQRRARRLFPALAAFLVVFSAVALLTAQPGVDRNKIQADITQQQSTLRAIATSASFNGQNWLSVDSSATGFNFTIGAQ
jgi:peptidoglycan/LPS O-acetylase OafA/YrhL